MTPGSVRPTAGSTRTAWVALVVVALMGAAPAPALAWGAYGHSWISGLGMEHLPPALPAFLHTADAVEFVAVLGREPDRWRDAGPEHDSERDAGHMLRLGDNGTVAGGPALDALPSTREAYDTALRGVGTTQYAMGYLPYAIVDGWQQLAKDFAIWRVDEIGARTAKTPADRAWLAADQRRREALILRDIGVWSHFVGDAANPMHVSVHYSGWGDHPNPNGYSTSPTLHARFEADFVSGHLKRAEVAKAMAAYRPCGCTIQQRTAAYLSHSNALVTRLYDLEKQDAFATAPPDARAFATERLAAGAAELRDMIVDAWDASRKASVGIPGVPVRDVESGKVIPSQALFGAY